MPIGRHRVGVAERIIMGFGRAPVSFKLLERLSLVIVDFDVVELNSGSR
jgi:hypothetical protein